MSRCRGARWISTGETQRLSDRRPHINAPEARLYGSRQLYEEALHVNFYLTLLDTYLPDPQQRAMDTIRGLERLDTAAERASSSRT